MTKEEIYERMTVSSICSDQCIECEFERDKTCMKLYHKVYDARVRIAERTGLDFEDRDLLEIVESMEKIARICALKMFDYGVKYGQTDKGPVPALELLKP